MKIKDIKNLTVAELEAKGKDYRQELFNLRVRQVAGQLEQPSRIRLLRRGIARVETLLNQHKRKSSATKS